MTLEQRLRDELHRAAPDGVADAPSVDDMTATVAGRHRRNRMGATIGAAVLAVGVIGGAASVVLPDNDTTDVIATANEIQAAEVTETPEAAPAEEEAAAAPAVVEEDQAVAKDAPPLEDVVEKDLQAEPAEPAEDAVDAPAPGAPTVAMQESAVDFAGGSGVLVTATETGFAGLASKFGGDAGVQAIGLTSGDGLNWTEVELTGVPAGATATALTREEGVHVALFSMFDVDAQRNNVYVGTSVDLADWTFSDALPGSEVVASSLAANADGIVVVGMAPNPQVWVGTFDGEFVAAGAIEGADSFAGITSSGSGFVGVGFSSNGAALFDSVDGTEWASSPIAALGAGETVSSASVASGSILLAGEDGGGVWTLHSADGGQSWNRGAEGSATSVLNSASGAGTFGLLGVNADDSMVLTLGTGDDLVETSLDLPAGDSRLSLLAAGNNSVVMLATTEDGLTWIVAER